VNSGRVRPSWLTLYVSQHSCPSPLVVEKGRSSTLTLKTHCKFNLIKYLFSRPERIRQIAVRYNLDPEQVLNNIMVGRAFTVDSLNNLIMQAAAAMIEDQFALMIIDSIMAPYRVDYSGRGELAERQQVLARMLSKI